MAADTGCPPEICQTPVLDLACPCCVQLARADLGTAWRSDLSMQRRRSWRLRSAGWRGPENLRRRAVRGPRHGISIVAARRSCRQPATGLGCSGPPGRACRSSSPPPRALRLLTGRPKAAAQCSRGQASATCHRLAHMPIRLRSQVFLPTRKLCPQCSLC